MVWIQLLIFQALKSRALFLDTLKELAKRIRMPA